ncbi:N-acetylmuramic acid 6-phosphate etherase [Sporolactobacillus putidus]|uniref:N-acetylmuramic acid 6-phosphate etherase n=1 Tax=Sporolactobacillus putidus TaxID=492735 RepID=A0A917VY29_9BACL|nr:N-acetylmuramic acid 6-phosphate etherase [Sporolactobacillus putidus]GGL43079.1 N-acetylmuramic acid 6-phosphate etherase [Sporolactobacillus putidus]
MIDHLSTEKRNEKTMNLDTMSIHDLLTTMNHEDRTVPQAVGNVLNAVEQAVQCVVKSFKSGGRLIYLGAGTSGRLGVLDAAECPPTFSVSSNMVQGIIAGGEKALTHAVEGIEDNEKLGGEDLKALSISEWDTIVGIAASGRTPYVIGGLKYAQKAGAKTISLSCNKNAEISRYANVKIEIETGPEVLTGSTRLKAGTAQKLVLNMISTASMVQIGKVYKNLMVDVQPTNQKLIDRAERIIMQATDIERETARKYFEMAHHDVKAAIVMNLLNCSYDEARNHLKHANGFIRETLQEGS